VGLFIDEEGNSYWLACWGEKKKEKEVKEGRWARTRLGLAPCRRLSNERRGRGRREGKKGKRGEESNTLSPLETSRFSFHRPPRGGREEKKEEEEREKGGANYLITTNYFTFRRRGKRRRKKRRYREFSSSQAICSNEPHSSKEKGMKGGGR